MPIISVRHPVPGEGLQEARLVEFIKKPGDVIKRDDLIRPDGNRQGRDGSYRRS